MQNQDPTADTDPNEYVNQLVQVNSLEQLININQNLSTALGIPSNGAAAGTGSMAAHGAPSGPASSAAGGTPAVSRSAAQNSTAQGEARSQAAGSRPGAAHPIVPGNLSVPAANPAADRVAHALGARRTGAI